MKEIAISQEEKEKLGVVDPGEDLLDICEEESVEIEDQPSGDGEHDHKASLKIERLPHKFFLEALRMAESQEARDLILKKACEYSIDISSKSRGALDIMLERKKQIAEIKKEEALACEATKQAQILSEKNKLGLKYKLYEKVVLYFLGFLLCGMLIYLGYPQIVAKIFHL